MGATPAFSAAATDRLPPPPLSTLSAPAEALPASAMGSVGKAVGRDASWAAEVFGIAFSFA